MRISARCDYACRALLELSLHWPNENPVPINVLAHKQKIPMRYLVQILIQLKRMDLVLSVRGKDGGYKLARAPQDISLGEVIRQISGHLLPLAETAQDKRSVFKPIWNEVEKSMSKVLDGITFEDIKVRSMGLGEVLAYEI